MNVRLLLRSSVVFLLCFAGGLALLLTVAKGNGGHHRGIRVGTVSAAELAAAREARPVGSGLPNFHRLEGPTFRRYESVELPRPGGGTETFRYLAYHLSCQRVIARERRAENVVFSMFPRPETAAEAKRLTEVSPDPVVTITAGEATAKELFDTEARATGESPAEWVLTLEKDVRIVSHAAGTRAELSAETLVCYSTERRVFSPGPVSIDADIYSIRGVGLSGDAGLGTFSVEKDVDVELPTAALLGPKAGDPGAKTLVHCGGPLLVRRLGTADPETGATPTKVTLKNVVHVSQRDGDGKEISTLDANRAELLLAVRKPEQKNAGNTAESVRLEKLDADGDVVFLRGKESRVQGSHLTLTSEGAGERIVLKGPALVRHRGELPQGTGKDGARARGELVVTAEEKVTIVSAADAKGRAAGHASFVGGVVARRKDEKGADLLTLDSDDLDLSTDPDEGEKLVAAGSATFSTPTSSGGGDRIEVTIDPAGDTAIHLSGSPRIAATGGGGTNPFALVPKEQSAPPTEPEEPLPVLHFQSKGTISLVEKGEFRTFTLSGPAVVRRTLLKKELLRVQADRIEAVLEGEELVSLTADGHVTASGSAPGIGASEVGGEADHFVFTEKTGTAVLSGSPARVTIAETAKDANEIAAPRMTFFSKDGRVLAEEGVSAHVYLPEEEGKTVRPVHLECRRLTVLPVQEGKERTAPSDPAGRIRSLTAEEEVVLDAREWRATGNRILYEGGGTRTISVFGEPARLTRRQTILGKEHSDEFTAPTFRIGLKDQKFDSFSSPAGGRFVLYRAYRNDDVSLLGGTGSAAPAGSATQLERFDAHCEGRLSFEDGKGQARMEKNARVEQYVGEPGALKRVAEFRADAFEADFDHRKSDGALLLRSMTGRDHVKGEGEGWTIRSDGFTVDVVEKTIGIWGAPATVHMKDQDFRVVRAVYDYEHQEWSKLLRGSFGDK